jgi:hypothetical protein
VSACFLQESKTLKLNKNTIGTIDAIFRSQQTISPVVFDDVIRLYSSVCIPNALASTLLSFLIIQVRVQSTIAEPFFLVAVKHVVGEMINELLLTILKPTGMLAFFPAVFRIPQ